MTIQVCVSDTTFDLSYTHCLLHHCVLACNSVLRIWPGQHGSNPPPLKAYCAPSVSNTIGPACGILALRYISYPAQVWKFSPTCQLLPLLHWAVTPLFFKIIVDSKGPGQSSRQRDCQFSSPWLMLQIVTYCFSSLIQIGLLETLRMSWQATGILVASPMGLPIM
jgi:hypothetical protein